MAPNDSKKPVVETIKIDVPDSEYPVGYCKPPLNTRFQPGRSGNPRGRRKRPRTLLETIEAALDRKVRVTEGGVARMLTSREVIGRQIVRDATKGNTTAIKLLLTRLGQEDQRREQSSQTPDMQAEDIALLMRYAPDLLTDAERGLAADMSGDRPDEGTRDPARREDPDVS